MCIRDLSTSGNYLVKSEMGNPWSAYVPLSSSQPCWFRTVTHRPTGFRALSGANQLRPNTGQNMRWCSDIFGFLFEIQLWHRYICLMPSPYRNTIITITGIRPCKWFFHKDRGLILIQVKTGVSLENFKTWLRLRTTHRNILRRMNRKVRSLP